MGWWNQNDEGHSFAGEMAWGDGPADIMDSALRAIEKEFLEAWGRKPTLNELRAGLLFSAAPFYEEVGDEDVPAES